MASAHRGSGGGGQETVLVVLRNRGAVTCELHGYPMVWFVDEAGSRVGPVSFHMAGGVAPAAVVLLPNGKASATVSAANPDVFTSRADCQPRRVSGLRLIPPHDEQPVHVPVKITICTVTANAGLGVWPIIKGTEQAGI